MLVALALAFANGANDNFKGVATLYGSRTLSYKSALALATGSTFLGSVVSVFLAQALIRAFSGKGLVPDEVAGDPAFLAAVGLGAAATVLLATRMGFPISTTHALTGALVGAGAVSAWSALNFGALGMKFALPLAVSPLLALVITAMLYPCLRWMRKRLGVERESCVCIARGQELVQVVTVDAAVELGVAQRVVAGTGQLELVVGEGCTPTERYQGTVAGVSAETVLTGAHVLSAGAVGFARGLNDTPKIAALLLVVPAFDVSLGAGLVGVMMALGGVVLAKRVAKTMSDDITPMNAGQGFTGNVVSAFLIIVASRMGVPVSTTHVTCGSLFGIGLATREGRAGVIGGILLSWVVTLPVAALLAALTSWCLRP